MPLRRSARIQQAECNNISERAPKRQRQNKTAVDMKTSRAPFTDVSNATSVVTRAKSRVQLSAKPSPQKTYKRARSVERPKLDTENRLRNESLSQATPVPVTPHPKREYIRKSMRTRTAQKPNANRIANDKHSEKLSTPSSEQAKRPSEAISLQMQSSSDSKHPQIEPAAFSTAERKSRDRSSPRPTRDSKHVSADELPSQPKDASRPKSSQRNLSPPPLYPEDEIQPVVLQPKTRQGGRPKPPPRPPSPPPLYPEDEIQPLPPKVKKQPAYGIRTKPSELTGSLASDRKFQPPRLSSPLPLALSHQPPTPPMPSSPVEKEEKNGKPALLNELSTAEQVKHSKPKSQIVKPFSAIPINDQPRQNSPTADLRPRETTSGLRSELEAHALYRSQISSRAPAPIHTYSKRRQNVQNFALPSRKSLGVRSRTSSGESPDSKSSSAYDSQNDERDDDEDSEASEFEESDREDPALVSFLGQQRKLWAEIDNIDLEEDLM